MALYKDDFVRIDLADGSIFRSFMNRTLGEGDIDATRFGVIMTRSGEAEDLTGVSCSGYFVRADGQTVVITGTVEDNKAFVTIPQSACAVEGNFSLAIKLVGNGVTGTMRIVDGTVSSTTTETVVDPGQVIPSIAELLAQIEACENATDAANAAAASSLGNFAPAFAQGTANTAGTYVTYTDGKVYLLPEGHTANTTWANTTKTAVTIGGEVYDLKSALRQLDEAVIDIANSEDTALDMTVSEWSSGRIDHGTHEVDNDAIYTTNKFNRGEVTSVAFDDTKYQLVFSYWKTDGTYVSNYGFLSTSPAIPFATVSNPNTTKCAVGIKTKNSATLDANDAKATTFFTYAVKNTLAEDIAEIQTNGVDKAKNLGTNIDKYSEKESSFTPAASGDYQVGSDAMIANHDFLVIITGNAVDSGYIANIRMILNGSWSGTSGKTAFNSGIYRVLSPTVANCYPAFYVNSDAVGHLCEYDMIVFDVTEMTVDTNFVNNLYDLYTNNLSAIEIMNGISSANAPNIWKGKNVLVIGDSLTANGIWANQLHEVLGMNVALHSKGGMPMVKLVDGENGIDGDYSDPSVLKPLSVADVTGKELIIFYAGYNDRGKVDGVIGDVYNPADQSGNTIAGHLQYAINRIYQTLASAGNLACRIAVVTPHCAGKYQYIDADGYQEFPQGSGRTMETMSDIMVDVANYNSLPCLNLWKTSGINRNTWTVFAYSPTPTNSSGTGDYPYPYNNDQLHLNDAVGYPYLGKRIADWVKGI